MGLVKKFNLIFSAVFFIGFIITSVILYNIEMNEAKEAVISKAELMLETAFASRHYTSEELEPFFMEKIYESENHFYPQAIPAYTANRIFQELVKKYPEYDYREVATNPRNLNDLPSAWEVEIIRYYKKNPAAKLMIYNRKIDDKELLYISYPIKAQSQCLKCHTDAQTAPKSLVKKYGSVNGMNWKLGEIIGAHFVSLPMSVPKKKARELIFTMLISLISIFTLMFIIINFMLTKWVVEPISKVAEITEKISLDKRGEEDFPKTSNREMKNLTDSIKRLEISLKKAISKMINKNEN
jgi:methyl-accepting chemotaxis protein